MQLSKETTLLTFFSTIGFALDYRIMLDGLDSVSVPGRTTTEPMTELQDAPCVCLLSVTSQFGDERQSFF